MKAYNIFLKEKREKNIVDNILFIQEGFDKKACLFNIYWLLKNKLFLFLFFIITFIFFLSIYNIYLGIFAFLCICILLGVYGNKLLIKNLIRIQNCKFLGRCVGNNLADAKKSFLDEWNKDLEKDYQNEKKPEESEKKDEFIFKDDF